MMSGVLITAIIDGRMISRSGRIKSYIVVGSIGLVVGYVMLGAIDHATPLAFVGVAMAIVGVGIGLTMQNLVLVVQNVVPLRDIGAASSAVAFFRSLGGTIGVSVLGAVLARRVAARIQQDLAAAGVPASVSSEASGSLDLSALPEFVQEIVRRAYADATGDILLISAVLSVVGLIAAAFLKPVVLRSSLDVPESERSGR